MYSDNNSYSSYIINILVKVIIVILMDIIKLNHALPIVLPALPLHNICIFIFLLTIEAVAVEFGRDCL